MYNRRISIRGCMTLPFIKIVRRSLFVGLGMLVAAVSTLAVLPAQSASAAGCRYYTTSTPRSNVAPASGEYGAWTYGATKTTPYGGCKDVNLSRSSIASLESHFGGCANFRIRYINSNGSLGAASQPTVYACTGYGNVVIKENVGDGRKYRVEASAPVSFQIHD